ncbi:MAG: ribosome maturation factor RimP [Bacteroidota bacterium]
MGVEELVQQIAEEAIKDDKSLFLVGVKLKGTLGNQKLLIWIDGDEGVTIDQCVMVNRFVSAALDEREDLIPGKYQLEVSSAGIDYPLQFYRQYKKNVGRSLKVSLKDGSEVKGELISVEEKGITLLEASKKAEKEVKISFDDMEQSKVLVSFK